jgi:hypothetical protein
MLGFRTLHSCAAFLECQAGIDEANNSAGINHLRNLCPIESIYGCRLSLSCSGSRCLFLFAASEEPVAAFSMM